MKKTFTLIIRGLTKIIKGGNDPMWLNKRSHHNKTSEVPWVVIMQC